MGAKPRVGVVITELGIPSEIWALRQCLGFREIEPVLFAWKRAENGLRLPPELETRLFRTPFPPDRSLLRRAAGRLGAPWSQMPGRAARADIRAALLEAKVEGVLCHFAWTAIPVVAALDGALPAVAHVHGRDVSALLRRPAYRRALARTLPRLAGLVTVGRFQMERLRPMGLPDRREVIPCGAPVDLFAARPAPERGSDEPIRFLSVGRLSSEKGVLETLEAFERTAARHPRAELAYVGDGPLAEALRAAVARSPAAARVRLLGRLESGAVAEEMSRAHVFLLHSRSIGGWEEGAPVVLVEAGAAGLPRIASRVGGSPELIEEGRDGFVIAPGDVAAQAEAMLALAEDEPRRREMGRAARRSAAALDSRLMTERLEAMILGALAGAGGASRG